MPFFSNVQDMLHARRTLLLQRKVSLLDQTIRQLEGFTESLPNGLFLVWRNLGGFSSSVGANAICSLLRLNFFLIPYRCETASGNAARGHT